MSLYLANGFYFNIQDRCIILAAIQKIMEEADKALLDKDRDLEKCNFPESILYDPKAAIKEVEMQRYIFNGFMNMNFPQHFGLSVFLAFASVKISNKRKKLLKKIGKSIDAIDKAIEQETNADEQRRRFLIIIMSGLKKSLEYLSEKNLGV